MFGFNSRTPLHAVYPAQLFASFVIPYGDASYLGTTAEMPLSVGLLLGVGLILFLLADLRGSKRLQTISRICAAFGLLMLLISSTLFPWSYVAKIPVLNQLLFAVQFPWRYLGLASFLLSVGFGLSAYALGQGRHGLLLAACLVLAVVNIAPYMDQFVQSDQQKTLMAEKYDVQDMEGYLLMDYFYADTDYAGFLNYPMQIKASGDITISGFAKQGTHLAFSYTASDAQTVTLPLYHYPGYTALLGGQPLPIADGDNHLMAVSLPAGKGTVTVRYEGFWYFNAANWASLLSLLALLGYALWKARQSRRTSAVI